MRGCKGWRNACLLVSRHPERHLTPSLCACPHAPAIVPSPAFNPPTVADTKAKFIEKYRKPVGPPYGQVLQELLVQQHFVKFNLNYEYNEVSM